MKQAGYLLLLLGFLGGAFTTVHTVETIPWGPYAGCAAAMVVGLVLVTRARKEESTASGRVDAQVQTLQESLTRLIAELQSMNDSAETLVVHDVRHQIDRTLLPDLDRFIEVRESMIPRFGLQGYVTVMDAFAGSERLLNRAWSASADGYVDEVKACLRGALGEMSRAQTAMQSLSAS